MNEPIDTMVPIDGELSTLKTLKGSNQSSFFSMISVRDLPGTHQKVLQVWNVISALIDIGNLSF